MKMANDNYNSVPVTSITVQVNSAGIHALEKQFREKEKLNVTFGDIVTYAIAAELKNYSKFNSFYDNGTILHKKINIGYVVNIGKGPKTFVLPDAGNMTLQQLASAIKGFVLKYLHDEDDKTSVTKTITVTNLSSFNAFSVAAPVYRGQSSTIAIASEFDFPKIEGDKLVNVRKFNITLSFDARVADCQVALEFLNAVKKRLEGTL